MRVSVLQKTGQFRQVYRDGTKIDCKYAVLFYYRTGEQTGQTRFGFVASKRVGNAVQRNRAKRLLREVVWSVAGKIADNNLWLVLVARSAILTTTYRDVFADIQAQLARAGLIPNDSL